ncbi:MAG: type II toxin-antitoxin system HipA family toxin [Lachnospiraceae bacterium]|nr:type II toxin-antitoxin system HipA family toxin [Lachnospiraceae bacterium]
MKANKVIRVLYHQRFVGKLALTEAKKAAFEYSEEWIEDGFSISPFSIPLKKQVFVSDKPYFGGLFGVFSDSLPDAWGQLLLNRVLQKSGQNVDELSVLDRLSIVGASGMGALTYEPETAMPDERQDFDLDELATQCKRILTTDYDDNLDELYRLGGTSGGARPKIMTKIQDEDWIIKFPAHVDRPNAGKMEYDYSLCARNCGIDMTETRLFHSKKCSGYFGTRRFDRVTMEQEERRKTEQYKVHMCTAAALLEADFRQPCLDYRDLMKLTKIMTGNNKADLENMFLRMCFNVFAHNRDDHAKNFTFLYDENNKKWKLSPAYDLTYSSTYYGEHTTSVAGNGKNPGETELIKVGTETGIPQSRCRVLMEQVRETVCRDLWNYMKEG